MGIHLSVLTAENMGANLRTHLREETTSSAEAHDALPRVLMAELLVEVLLCGRCRVGGKHTAPLRPMLSEVSQSSRVLL